MVKALMLDTYPFPTVLYWDLASAEDFGISQVVY